MKKVAIKVIAASALLALVSAPVAKAAEASVGLDIASAYVFRGVTYNENFVAQPYLEVSGLPIDLGVWANYDIESDDARGYTDNQFSEVDIYASYSLPIEAVDVSIGYTEYLYPGVGGDPVVDVGAGTAESTQGESDREVSLTLGLGDVLLAPSVGVYYGIDGGIEENLYAQADIGHEIALTEGLNLALGAAVGYLDPEEGEDGFSHYQVSASVTFAILTVGVTYIDTIDDDVLGDDYDVELVGTVGLAYDF